MHYFTIKSGTHSKPYNFLPLFGTNIPSKMNSVLSVLFVIASVISSGYSNGLHKLADDFRQCVEDKESMQDFHNCGSPDDFFNALEIMDTSKALVDIRDCFKNMDLSCLNSKINALPEGIKEAITSVMKDEEVNNAVTEEELTQVIQLFVAGATPMYDCGKSIMGTKQFEIAQNRMEYMMYKIMEVRKPICCALQDLENYLKDYSFLDGCDSGLKSIFEEIDRPVEKFIQHFCDGIEGEMCADCMAEMNSM